MFAKIDIIPHSVTVLDIRNLYHVEILVDSFNCFSHSRISEKCCKVKLCRQLNGKAMKALTLILYSRSVVKKCEHGME
jgi:hypothetical protein